MVKQLYTLSNSSNNTAFTIVKKQNVRQLLSWLIVRTENPTGATPDRKDVM